MAGKPKGETTRNKHGCAEQKRYQHGSRRFFARMRVHSAERLSAGTAGAALRADSRVEVKTGEKRRRK